MPTGADLRPVTPAWQWNIRAAACFRQTNIGNPHPGRDLRDRRCPQQLVQILSFQIVRAPERREVSEERQIRIDTFHLNVMTECLGNLNYTAFLRRLPWVINIICNALSRGAQDTNPKLGKIVLVDALDRMAHQQVQNNWVDAELGANALEQPAKIVRRDAGPLTTSGLAFSEYPNERLSQLGVTDVQQLVEALRIE